jgi:hypothetical protein
VTKAGLAGDGSESDQPVCQSVAGDEGAHGGAGDEGAPKPRQTAGLKPPTAQAPDRSSPRQPNPERPRAAPSSPEQPRAAPSSPEESDQSEQARLSTVY